MAEWLMAADCKSAGLTPYGGSNPSLGTINKTSCVVHQAGIAQLVERQPSKLNVAGSNPVSRSIATKCYGPHSSVAEHFLGKEEVAGSIPAVGSI